MIILKDLIAVRVAYEALAHIAQNNGITEDEYPLWFSEKLVGSHPPLTALFEASVARIIPIDVSLSAHLSLFQRIYLEIEKMLNRWSKDYSHFHEHGKPVRSKEDLIADAHLIKKNFDRAV